MTKEAASEVTGSFSYAIGLRKDESPVNQLTHDKHMKKVQETSYSIVSNLIIASVLRTHKALDRSVTQPVLGLEFWILIGLRSGRVG